MRCAYPQDSKQNPFAEKTKSENTLLEAKSSNSLLNNSADKFQKNSDERFEFMKSIQINIYKAPIEVKENYRFDLIQSVNSNVKFGGFFNGSVNIQFSPAMYIKPFEFLSIYANRQKNLFIPMGEIESNIFPLAIETTGMVAIENIIKFFAPPDKVVRGIAAFALKNAVSFLLYSVFNSNKSNNSGVYKYDFYYISTGIIF